MIWWPFRRPRWVRLTLAEMDRRERMRQLIAAEREALDIRAALDRVQTERGVIVLGKRAD